MRFAKPIKSQQGYASRSEAQLRSFAFAFAFAFAEVRREKGDGKKEPEYQRIE
jgi:hypothetical protein